jgi:hypothetical protein
MVAKVAWSRKGKILVVKQQQMIGLVGQYLSQVADRNTVVAIAGTRSNTSSDKNGNIL